jgi:hypothetical protein
VEGRPASDAANGRSSWNGSAASNALLETRGARTGLRRKGVIYFHDDERGPSSGRSLPAIRHVPRSRSSSSFLFTRLKHPCPLRTSNRARSPRHRGGRYCSAAGGIARCTAPEGAGVRSACTGSTRSAKARLGRGLPLDALASSPVRKPARRRRCHQTPDTLRAALAASGGGTTAFARKAWSTGARDGSAQRTGARPLRE